MPDLDGFTILGRQLQIRFLARQLFGSEVLINAWLDTPQPIFAYQKPRTLMKTGEGSQRVISLLRRMTGPE